ncbi:MAG: SGNH/GDSL hydrolase family protein [FCB group bacterium]|jgi:lysophospholipase L1-like esterase|nr:SGNH/GDSL hydrolase family protein [FCB group bacterium]
MMNVSRKRVLFWGGVLVVSVAAVWLYLYLFLLKPEGRGPAGPPVPAAAFQQPWTQRRVLALGIGDSVTAGFGAQPPSFSYFARLVENPPEEFPELHGVCLKAVLPNLEARNLSVSSTTSDQHLAMQVESFETQPAELLGLVFMTSGGNDLIHNYGRTAPKPNAMYGATLEQARPWIAEFETRLEKMVTMLRDKFPGGCHIFLANIYDPSDGLGKPESVGLPPWPDLLPIHREYNAIIERCAAKHDFVHIVDMHAAFLGHGVYCTQPWTPHYRWRDPHYWYNVNLEDPNNRGYDALRRLFLLEVSKVKDQIASH